MSLARSDLSSERSASQRNSSLFLSAKSKPAKPSHRCLRHYQGEDISFAGHGLIRWAEPDECLLGVEILNLEEACRDWVIGLIALNAGSSYIPRAPRSVAPRSKTAK